MKIRLQQIAEIKGGVFCKTSSDGDAIYLQANDLHQNGEITDNLRPNVYIAGKLRNRLLTPGNIVFMCKGVNNWALLYNPEIHPPIIASTAFLIISKIHPSVLPEYLTWYINQPEAQQYLKGQAKGSSPPSITIKILEQLEVYVPDVSTQKKVLKIHQLELQQEKLKCDIENLKRTLRHQQILKAIRK